MTNDSFWTGGPRAYEKAIRKKYQPQLDVLRKSRKQLAGPAREKIDIEIERVEKEFKAELDSIDDCLF